MWDNWVTYCPKCLYTCRRQDFYVKTIVPYYNTKMSGLFSYAYSTLQIREQYQVIYCIHEIEQGWFTIRRKCLAMRVACIK